MEPKSIPTNNHLQTIKDLLEHGDITSVAKQHNVSRSFVSQILNPDSEKSNDKILESLIEVAERNKKQQEIRKNRIENLAG
jgi:DNA-binding LacI/PurR family transcriptional regulator